MTEQAQEVIYTGSDKLLGVMGAYVRYVVPPYQREYGWGNAECEALLSDILESAEAKTPHFLGHIVLCPVEHNLYELIDGQQRLTTILLLTLAAAIKFKATVKTRQYLNGYDFPLENCLNRLHTRYVDSSPRPMRLTLGHRNNDYFEMMIRNLKIIRPGEYEVSNKRVYDALKLFENAFHGIDSDKLADVIEEMYEQLYMNVIKVNSWHSAFTVFESINNDASQQQVADLIKNVLMSKLVNGPADKRMIEEQLSKVETCWHEIIDEISPGEVSNFLRTVELLNADGETVQMKDLLARVSDRITSKQAAEVYMRELRKYAGVYKVLRGFGNDSWKHQGKTFSGTKDVFATMRRFGLRLPMSLLLAAADKFSPEEFRLFAKNILTFSIRFNVVCKLPTRNLEMAYCRMAKKIKDGEAGPVDAIRTLVKEHGPNDETFRSQFRKMTAHKHKALYFLSEIEAHVGNGPTNDMAVDKIIPADANGYWKRKIDSSMLKILNDSLANYFLVESEAINGSMETFEKFRRNNATSSFSINRKIAGRNRWDKESIAAHQRWLAAKAADVWKLEVR